MKQGESNDQGTSLEEHLTNSIRRAKERIYNNAITQYSQDISLSAIDHRHRTNSSRHLPHREDNSVLVEAMRTLQSKIAQLQQENKELTIQNASLHPQQHFFLSEEKEKEEILRMQVALKEKESEVKKMVRENTQLNEQNTSLMRRVQDLEEQVDKFITRQLDTSQSRVTEEEMLREREEAIRQKQSFIHQQEQKIAQLEDKYSISQQTIQQLTHKLEEERRINMRWIKLHESQMEADQKENSSLQANQPQPQPQSSNAHSKRQGTHQLVRKNKEMYEHLQRSKAKTAELTRECKQLQQKYSELKLITTQIVQTVHKMYPHHNGSHLKYLTTKILKLESSHLESLRSFSNRTRNSRRTDRPSGSKERKRSLKMSDLSSSPKKSREGSHSKSHKKRQPLEEPRSEKKKGREQEGEELQKEVQTLMKKYRNLVARGDKDKNNQQINRLIEETAKEYNEKKLKFQQMKKQQLKKALHN